MQARRGPTNACLLFSLSSGGMHVICAQMRERKNGHVTEVVNVKSVLTRQEEKLGHCGQGAKGRTFLAEETAYGQVSIS